MRYISLFLLFLVTFKSVALAQHTATLSGKIINHIPGTDSSLLVFVGNVIGDEQTSFVGNVKHDGNFEVSFAIPYPQLITVGYLNTLNEIFISPNTQLSIEIDNNGPEKVPQNFNGDNAQINNEIALYKKAHKTFMADVGNALTENIKAAKNVSATEFKKATFKRYEAEHEFLLAFVNQKKPSEQFAKWAGYDILYQCGNNLLRHNWDRPNANQPLPETYYDIYDKIPLDDPNALCSRAYAAYLSEYYQVELPKLKNTTTIPLRSVIVNLIESKAPLAPKERKRLQAILNKNSDTPSLFNALYLKKMFDKYEDQIATSALSTTSFKAMMDDLLKRPPGFLRDVMVGSFFASLVDANYIEALEPLLSHFNASVQTKFIRDQVITQFNAGKNINSDTNRRVNALPQKPKELKNFFDELIKPYKGKVTYIDVWGTWCEPCIANMPQYDALRAEFANKDVVFVFLAVSSPIDTWQRMIRQLKIDGENFRLSKTEYELMVQKFAMNGVPHYILIDKSGKVYDRNAPTPDSPELKRLIAKLVASTQ